MKALLTALALSPTLALAQDMDFSKVQVTATPVAGNVHLLVGAGGNIAVSAGPDGVLVVDDQFAPLAPKINKAIDKLSKKKIQYVLNTHWHFDHTGGNPVFGKEGLIVAHDAVRTRLSAEQKIFGQPVAPLPKEGLPVITYDNQMSIFFNGEEIRLTHFPAGHTDGDTVVYFTSSNVMHTGDQFIVDSFPFFDMENGGTVEGYVRNLEKILQTLPPDVKIIPGHGPLAKKEDMERMVAMLKESTAMVRASLAAGKTLEQVKAQSLGEKYKSWSNAFIKEEQYLEMVYKGLSASAKSPAAPAPAPAPGKK
ncbi:MBL fold metallo-hydrolase [Hyalangium rubrum]|uniref:MBL fold metallo-hydrolase n=1 Tax=Hyalangium rubrum TaxID=3103134 RepID=A0ABU5HG29_9BACT|nr:MBL fold metallo-hydrolase [Hyalangium sp. s54d21]MDY7232316.1 MBL fold metallo-hydrolase [Hyalangium sp. s54d21]